MTDLSDADKRVLLGNDYKAAQMDLEKSRGHTDQSRQLEKRERQATDLISAAIGFGVVAFLIGFANYHSHGTPYSPTLVIGCAVVVMASIATVLWFRRARTSMRSSQLRP